MPRVRRGHHRSIRSYDPSTQRSTAAIDQAAIAPLQELVVDDDLPDRSATFADYLRCHGRPVVLVAEPDEVAQHGGKLTAQLEASHEEALAKGLRVDHPSVLAAAWEDASAWLEGATALESLSIGTSDADAVHIACQPARVRRPDPRVGRRDAAAASAATR